MSEDLKGSGGAPDDVAGGSNQDVKSDIKKDVVSYDSFNKVLTEKKKLSEKFDTMESELQKLREEKLIAEGNKDELITVKDKKIQELELKLQNAVGTFAHKSIRSQIESKARDMGCTNTKFLLKAIEGQFKDLDIDEEFTVAESDLDTLLGNVKEEAPMLFSKAAPQIKDGVPRKDAGKPTKKRLSDMSKDELAKAFGEVLKR